MTKKVCLSSFASPWFFGPYGAQMYHLISKLIEEDDIEIYYLLLVNCLEDRLYDFDEMFSINFENENKDKTPKYVNLELLKKVKYIGGIVKDGSYDTILSSTINYLLEKHNIDVYIFLSDINHVICDEQLSCRSLCWYPNHFQPIVKHTANTLPIFSDIVALCPTDKILLENTIQGRNVHFIPHILNIKEEYLDYKSRKIEFRDKHKIPQDKFVVLINIGNYEVVNRKSLDTSLLAFEEFQKNRDDAFLFIHAWSIHNLQKSHQKTSNMLMNIHELLDIIPIPKEKVRLHQEIVDYEEILEYIAMSDVLMQGSKCEGFGIPILESQLLRTPVITTKFGAMSDYTYYGVSVPYLKKEYLPMAKGFWAVPHVNGMSAALTSIYNKEPIGDATVAQHKIKEMTNIDNVYNQFLTLIREPFTSSTTMRKSNEIICIRVHFNGTGFNLYKNFDLKLWKTVDKLSCDDLIGKWTVFIHENRSVDPLFFLFQALHHELIILKEIETTGEVYPDAEMIQSMTVDFSRLNYAILTTIIKHLFTSELNNIYNAHKIYYFLTHVIGRTKIALSDNIVCKVNQKEK